MKSFRTKDGTDWQVTVSVATIKRVMDRTGLKLTDLFTAEKIKEFFADEIRFCEVVYATVLPQAEAAGKSLDDFLGVVDGEVIESAAEALLAEVADFFQEPRKGLLKKVMEKYQEATARLRTEGGREAERILEGIDFERLFLQTPTNSALNSPASAA